MIIHDTITCQPACRGVAGRCLFLQSIYLQSINLSSCEATGNRKEPLISVGLDDI